VRCDIERDEEGRIRERGGRDDVLPGDVDGGEPRRRQQPDEEEVDKLPVAQRQGTPSAS
jgi:hypothetical protein